MVKIKQSEIDTMKAWCQSRWATYNRITQSSVKMGIFPIARNDMASDLNAYTFLKYHPKVYFANAISGWWWRVPKDAVLYLVNDDKLMWYNPVNTQQGTYAGWHVFAPENDEAIIPL